MQQWMLYTKRADFNALAEKYDISPVTARIMVNRGVAEADFNNYLHGDINTLHDPHLMKDMDKAVDMILAAVKENKRIRIVGDYDIDGVSSTYILYTALKRIGADVSYEIPDRVRDGYGINENIIREARNDNIDMILTCDNGIAAFDAIALAKRYGMQVVITDHHEVPKDADGEEILPEADAIVNPHQKLCPYPYKNICGGMVAFKLAYVLYEKSGVGTDEWESLIDFAALATVGDVMPLSDENRTVCKLGLKSMGRCINPGLTTLTRLQGLDPESLTAYHIGFIVGPCLNAGGRLESAKIALELLLAEDETEAKPLAERLIALNDSRKDMTAKFTALAEELIGEKYAEDKVKVVYLPGCHESIAGIIAGRIRESFNHPAIVLTDSDDGVLKGSARSIEAYNIYEHLTEAAGLLEKFGGHKLAAGLSLKKENLDEFRSFLNGKCCLEENDFTEKIWIDVALPFEYNSEDFIEELKLLEPFGTGNEKPVFAQKNVEIVNARVLGKNHNLVKLKLKSEDGYLTEALYFTDADKWLKEIEGKRKLDILYFPQINEYNGVKTIQLVLKGVRA